MASEALRAHLEAQAELRALASRGVLQVWDGLPNYDEESVGPFLAAVVPFMLAVLRFSVQSTDAYVAAELDRRPLGLDPLPIIDGIRGDARIPVVYRRPFVTVWSDLSERKSWEQAVVAGRDRLDATVAVDVQLVHRATLQAVQDVDLRIRGWTRAANLGACEYCRMLDGVKVRSANALAMHNRCGCGLEPSLETVEDQSIPEGVAVHEHGELGAIVGSSEHSFTGPSDISSAAA